MKKVLSVLITAALMLQLLAMFGAVSAAGAAAMTVSPASGTVGDTVTVEVGIANNPGFHALECQIEYDKTLLELVSIEGKIGTPASPDSTEGWLAYPSFIYEVEGAHFAYMGLYILEENLEENSIELGFAKVTGDVPVAKLTFKMLATGSADVTVNCIASVALDENYEEMVIIPTSSGIGTITIAEAPAYVRGDVNGDGVVDDNDAIQLLLFTLFGAEDYPINQNGDMNGDGVEDDSDVIHLLLFTLFGAEDYPLSQ